MIHSHIEINNYIEITLYTFFNIYLILTIFQTISIYKSNKQYETNKFEISEIIRKKIKVYQPFRRTFFNKQQILEILMHNIQNTIITGCPNKDYNIKNNYEDIILRQLCLA